MTKFRFRQASFNHANSGSPEGLASLLKGVFTRNSNVIQHSVIQGAQVLTPLLAN
jgi:hypothetical protein